MSLIGTEIVSVVSILPGGAPSPFPQPTTTQAIADLGTSGGSSWIAAEVNYTLDNTTPTDIVLDLTVMAMRVGITTDGSGLAQVINLPNFALDGNGEATQHNGYRVSVSCDVQITGADVPLVTAAGGITLSAFAINGTKLSDYLNTTGSGPGNSIPIDYAGACASFIWCDEHWRIDNRASNNNDAFELKSSSFVPPSGATDEVLTKSSNSSGATSWHVPQQATARTVLGPGTTILNFTDTFGAISPLTGTEVTEIVIGLLTTDQVHVECVGAPPSGYIPPNARVSADDTLKLYFNTAVALGITLGSLDFRLTVIR